MPAGSKIKTNNIFLLILIVKDHKHGAVNLIQMCKNNLVSLILIIKNDVNFIDGVLVVKDMENDKIEKHVCHDIIAPLVFFGLL